MKPGLMTIHAAVFTGILLMTTVHGLAQGNEKENDLYKGIIMGIPIMINPQCARLRSQKQSVYYTLNGRVIIAVPSQDSTFTAISTEIISMANGSNKKLYTLNIRYNSRNISYHSEDFYKYPASTHNDRIILDTSINVNDTIFVETKLSGPKKESNIFKITRAVFKPNIHSYKIVNKMDSLDILKSEFFYKTYKSIPTDFKPIPPSKKLVFNSDKTLLIYLNSEFIPDGNYIEYRIKGTDSSEWIAASKIIPIKYDQNNKEIGIDIRVLGHENIETLWVAMEKQNFLSKTGILFLGICSAIILISIYIKLITHKKEKRKKRIEAIESLKALNSQLQPHFLSNSLNHLLVLTSNDQYTKSSKFLNALNSFFKEVVKTTDKLFVPLSEEIALCRNYIDIFNTRHDITLEINCRNDLKHADVEIPPLILQPFIENALKFSGSEQNESIKISINIYNEEKNLIFDIENKINLNNTINNQGTKNGINISNRRLSEACKFVPGSRHTIIQSSNEGKYIVTIKLYNWI